MICTNTVCLFCTIQLSENIMFAIFSHTNPVKSPSYPPPCLHDECEQSRAATNKCETITGKSIPDTDAAQESSSPVHTSWDQLIPWVQG